MSTANELTPVALYNNNGMYGNNTINPCGLPPIRGHSVIVVILWIITMLLTATGLILGPVYIPEKVGLATYINITNLTKGEL